MANPAFMSAAQPAVLAIYRYLARSLVDGSPSAASMFDEMVGLGEQWLARLHPGQMADPWAYAALLVAMEMGALFMRDQLSRTLGADVFSPEGHVRLARARVDFYSQPLLSPDLAAQALAAIDLLQAAGTANGRHG